MACLHFSNASSLSEISSPEETNWSRALAIACSPTHHYHELCTHCCCNSQMDEEITFRRPMCRNQVIFVWGLRNLSWTSKMRELENLFSRFGLLYSLYVPQNAHHAFVKYYSRKAASMAVRRTDGKAVIGRAVLKVEWCS